MFEIKSKARYARCGGHCCEMVMSPIVGGGALILGLIVLGFGISIPETMGEFWGEVQAQVSLYFTWLYIFSLAAFFVYLLWLAFASPYGDIVLGRPGDVPEFSFMSWVAMLFASGIGTGIFFWGVAEPMIHFLSVPPYYSDEEREDRLMQNALVYTFFHWGFIGWATYITVGVSIAYFSHRHGMPLGIRYTMQPLLGEGVNGFAGQVVDLAAASSTLFGLSTSLGLGSMTITAGIAELSEGRVSDDSLLSQLLVIAGTVVVASLSAVSGVGKGVKILSEITILASTVLLLLIVLLGPTTDTLDMLVQSLASYVVEMPPLMFYTGAGGGNESWMGAWTVFYWAWWVAVAPLVGLFIARISKGRTIRDFIWVIALVPTVYLCVFVTVVAVPAFQQEIANPGTYLDDNGEVIPETALFVMLSNLQLPVLPSALALGCMLVYLVTSVDSTVFVLSEVTSGADAPAWQRALWATIIGGVSASMLLAGGLEPLQAISIVMGSPFLIVMWFMAASLIIALKQEKVAMERGKVVAELCRGHAEEESSHNASFVSSKASSDAAGPQSNSDDGDWASSMEGDAAKSDLPPVEPFVTRPLFQWRAALCSCQRSKEGRHEQEHPQQRALLQAGGLQGDAAAAAADSAPHDHYEAAEDSDRACNPVLLSLLLPPHVWATTRAASGQMGYFTALVVYGVCYVGFVVCVLVAGIQSASGQGWQDYVDSGWYAIGWSCYGIMTALGAKYRFRLRAPYRRVWSAEEKLHQSRVASLARRWAEDDDESSALVCGMADALSHLFCCCLANAQEHEHVRLAGKRRRRRRST